MAILLKYKDELIVQHSVEEAQACISRRLPDLPDEVIEEDDDCEQTGEFSCVVGEYGKVTLISF